MVTMMKSKNYYPTQDSAGAPDGLHLSGLLTAYDPERSTRGLSARPPARLRAHSASAVSASGADHRGTRSAMPPIPSADPLTELGMLSARASRGGIGGIRSTPKGKQVPMGAISVLVVIVATAVVGFVCRRPLRTLAALGSSPVVDHSAVPPRSIMPSPQLTPTSTVVEAPQQAWKSPAAPVPVLLAPMKQSSRSRPAVRPSPVVTADNSSDGDANFSTTPPGDLFTHIGTSQ